MDNGKRGGTMEKEQDPLKCTVREVMAGIAVCGGAELLICLLAVGQGSDLKWRSMAGVVLGCLAAAGLFWHMKCTVKQALGGREAKPFIPVRAGYLIRLVAAAGLILLAAFTDFVPALAVLAGLLTLKPAVYLQPVIHRLLCRRQGNVPEGQGDDGSASGT